LAEAYQPLLDSSINSWSNTKAVVASRHTTMTRASVLSATILIGVLLTIAADVNARRQEKPSGDLNVALMQSTFQISGPKDSSHTTRGTVFLLGNPIPNTTDTFKIVLVTAKHVLADIAGPYGVLWLRERDSESSWASVRTRIRIRDGDRKLWAESSDADVAVAYLSMPLKPMDEVVPIELLATDKTLTDFSMAPGVELNCLGYPYGAASNDIGFPILRGGTIASYPLTPSDRYRTFMFDFRVFPGNSGGPVYFAQQPFRGSTTIAGPAQFIVGLVTEEELAALHENAPLSLAAVVQASTIRAVIANLPAPGSPEARAAALEVVRVPPTARSLDF
jgi:hypothetical protein